jgi:hypothetical protein
LQTGSCENECPFHLIRGSIMLSAFNPCIFV